MATSTMQAIVSSGSNANGKWIRFADGTQICTKAIGKSVTFTTTWGNMYESPVVALGDWAMPFTQTPFVSGVTVGKGCFIESFSTVSATAIGNVFLCRPTKETTAIAVQVHVTGIGRWE